MHRNQIMQIWASPVTGDLIMQIREQIREEQNGHSIKRGRRNKIKSQENFANSKMTQYAALRHAATEGSSS